MEYAESNQLQCQADDKGTRENKAYAAPQFMEKWGTVNPDPCNPNKHGETQSINGEQSSIIALPPHTCQAKYTQRCYTCSKSMTSCKVRFRGWRRCYVHGFGMELSGGERLGHPRRGGKPEFKLERYPPLDEPACSLWILLLSATDEPVTSQSGSSEIRRRMRMNCRIMIVHKITIQTGKGQTRNANAWNPHE